MSENIDQIRKISIESLEGVDDLLGADDYISLSSALKCSGLYNDEIQTVYVISSRRRRNFSRNGLNVCFIYRDSKKITELESHLEKRGRLRLARPYMAWLDMLDRLKHAPDFAAIAGIAQVIPFNLNDLTAAAATLSDAVYKRALFFLGWCGRIGSFSRLPFKLSETPVYLDTRIEKENLAWEKNLKVFFPVALLDKKVDENPVKRYDWRYFRNSEAFLGGLKKTSQLILQLERSTRVFNELKFPEKPVALPELEDWLRRIRLAESSDNLDNTDIEAMGKWLKPLFHDNNRRSALIKSLEQTAPEQIRKNFRLCQTLLKLALAIKSEEVLKFVLHNFSVDIYLYGETGLLTLATGHIGTPLGFTGDTIAVLVMALLGSGHHEQANELFMQAQLDVSEEALPVLCRACVMMLVHIDPLAEGLFVKAIELFARHGRNDLMILGKIYLGVWFLLQQRFDEALAEYRQLIGDTTINNVPESLQPILYANLGVVALGTGNHRQAVEILKTAIQQCQKTSYASAYAQLLYYYTWNHLLIGNFAETITSCQTALDTVNKTGSSFIVERIYALLIFTNLILGRIDEADQWLAVLKERHEIGGREEARLTEILKAFHSGDLIRAEKICSSEGQLLRRTDVPTLLTQHAQVIYSWFLEKRNPGEASEYVNSILYFENTKSLFHLMFYGRVFRILLSDASVKEQNEQIASHLEISESAGRYDPYWFLIADLLADRKLGGLKTYVLRQYKLSPQFMRNFAIRLLQSKPALIKLIKPLEQSGKDRFIVINSLETSQISASEYESTVIKATCGKLLHFDAGSRKIIFNGQKSVLRQNTMQMALLEFLLKNQARRQPIKSLFEAVWQTEFDEEFSTDTVKAVIKRLNSWFKQRALPIRLNIISVTGRKYVCIDIDADWEGIFPLDKAKGNTDSNGQGFSRKQE